ncbi:unnamed protein product [Linum tenue]|uniref:RNase H type-1 domain-containing protein n=1 Tax=Linum tenue TaxID=586396 RepID=A0AAV0GVP1_9ROSI|nr:unnamed protein product [Linum tenue]
MEGLQLAWNLGLLRIIVEIDSQCAVQLLRNQDAPDHPHAAIIHRFQELLHRDWDVTIHHIYREGNKGADFLATMYLVLSLISIIFFCMTVKVFLRLVWL